MPDVELEAMAAVAGALEQLDEGQRTRVLRWAADRFDVELRLTTRRQKADDPEEDDTEAVETDEDSASDAALQAPSGGAGVEFEHFAELYDACGPTTPAARALVAAYWVQTVQGKTAWGSFDANKLLKDLGHGDGHINQSFSSNMTKKPALVLQLKKTGKSQQGRKTYKLTTEGIKAVKAMMKA